MGIPLHHAKCYHNNTIVGTALLAEYAQIFMEGTKQHSESNDVLCDWTLLHHVYMAPDNKKDRV